jgi:hypothetical protein
MAGISSSAQPGHGPLHTNDVLPTATTPHHMHHFILIASGALRRDVSQTPTPTVSQSQLGTQARAPIMFTSLAPLTAHGLESKRWRGVGAGGLTAFFDNMLCEMIDRSVSLTVISICSTRVSTRFDTTDTCTRLEFVVGVFDRRADPPQSFPVQPRPRFHRHVNSHRRTQCTHHANVCVSHYNEP